ncbi:cobalt/nickel transport system ATP-binding protein [Serratia fonticola]|jgi:cobalt/nickel transport system ATP-binding protein|uniref:ABC transporter ATP-binding protein n=1 Tax=Serratia fonticola TaxID=47917 RepID=A0A559TCH4_SERFO|nr:ATP-binding cassette domain-containing protein [Serratia fonticola]TQI80158.1 cobalt/nickel transport system ATP-binding protein [Serratia fonticola]TQI97815.1 cobalt/nickel transport system ATP-binding protein [Serratia fonticola]TVZ72313.1 cobalt/nickel transport system ATP-binding protein [Serratia fonticola]
MLTTRQLSFSYQDEPVLQDLTLDFGQHAVTGILGANGCGKSTLFMHLTGILRPQQGEVQWQGEALRYDKRSLRALRQRVTTVFQDPEQQIFYTDIDSDIAFSLHNLGLDKQLIAQRVERALTLVDAQSFRHKPVQHLSHGQKKRVAIAGALVMEADFLLLDEPTAGLDPAGRLQMITIIERIVAEGKRVIISSHDIDLIYQVCDHLYVLSHGRLIDSGETAQVFMHQERLAAAGLVQPWLVKLHSKLGLPLCKTEEQLFALQRQRDGERM